MARMFISDLFRLKIISTELFHLKCFVSFTLFILIESNDSKMENSQPKSANKRPHDENDSESTRCKQQRLESCDDDQLDLTAKITDCDDICLVKMFGHLSLMDLLRTALANKLLVPAARDLFKRKFGARTMHISGCDDLRPNTRANARTGDVNRSTAPREKIAHSINIRHLKTTLRFLRCFGPVVSRVSISYNKSKSRRYQFVHQYINQNCAENLAEISLLDMPNISLQQFNERPFVNVTCVNINDCHLGKQLPSMVQWFPNLQTLKLSKIELNHRFVNAAFRQLETLEVCMNDSNGFTINDLATFVSLNRQLRNISITATAYQKHFSMTKLLDTIRDHQQIDKLVVRVISESMLFGLNSVELDRIPNEHPALISLDLLFCCFKIDHVIVLLRQLKSLKRFNFMMRHQEYEKLKPMLDNEWAPHFFASFVTVKRN